MLCRIFKVLIQPTISVLDQWDQRALTRQFDLLVMLVMLVIWTIYLSALKGMNIYFRERFNFEASNRRDVANFTWTSGRSSAVTCCLLATYETVGFLCITVDGRKQPPLYLQPTLTAKKCHLYEFKWRQTGKSTRTDCCHGVSLQPPVQRSNSTRTATSIKKKRILYGLHSFDRGGYMGSFDVCVSPTGHQWVYNNPAHSCDGVI